MKPKSEKNTSQDFIEKNPEKMKEVIRKSNEDQRNVIEEAKCCNMPMGMHAPDCKVREKVLNEMIEAKKNEKNTGAIKKQLDYKLITKKPTRKQMMDWHRKVCERYNWTCFNCGKYFGWDWCFENYVNKYVCGDHIKTRGSHPELVLDPNNGRCTCLDCHNKRHNGEL